MVCPCASLKWRESKLSSKFEKSWIFALRRGLGALLFLFLLSFPASAQKNLEDLPIEDVVPTPMSAAKPSPTIAPPAKAKSTPTSKPAVTAKPSPTSTPAQLVPAQAATAAPQSIEDAPIEDVVPTPTLAAPKKPAPAVTASQSAPSEPEVTSEDEAAPKENWIDIVHTFTAPHLDFMRHALWAGLLVALMCSYLGVYVVLRRIVFVGVALAELSSAGIAVGLWLGFSPIWGAIGLMLTGVLMFSIRWAPRRVPVESLIGIVYSMAGALAILCIAKSAQGEVQITKALQGDVLTVAPNETWEMLGVFAVVGLIHALFAKEFLLVSFDHDAAATLGLRTMFWDFLLYLTIGIVISFSIRAAGVLVATALLIIPAVSALLIAPRMKYVWPIALLFGIVPVLLGLHFSFVFDLPASAVIVALSFLLLLPVLAFSPQRS